jgi:hypothetical protein
LAPFFVFAPRFHIGRGGACVVVAFGFGQLSVSLGPHACSLQRAVLAFLLFEQSAVTMNFQRCLTPCSPHLREQRVHSLCQAPGVQR